MNWIFRSRVPGAPGQFAFADGERVQRLLQAAGWNDVEVVAVDLPCSLAREDLPTYVGHLGPLGLALRSMPEARAAVLREKHWPHSRRSSKVTAFVSMPPVG